MNDPRCCGRLQRGMLISAVRQRAACGVASPFVGAASNGRYPPFRDVHGRATATTTGDSSPTSPRWSQASTAVDPLLAMSRRRSNGRNAPGATLKQATNRSPQQSSFGERCARAILDPPRRRAGETCPRSGCVVWALSSQRSSCRRPSSGRRCLGRTKRRSLRRAAAVVHVGP